MNKKLSDFFLPSGETKRLKRTIDCKDNLTQPSSTTLQLSTSTEKVTSSDSDEKVECNDNALPDCWTNFQKTEFCEKYDWLLIKNGKLGCSTCKEVGILSVKKKTGMKISKEWANVEIYSYGDTKQKKQTSLRKKIFDHKESSGHKAAAEILTESKDGKLEKTILRQRSHEKEITGKIFRTAYKVVKENQSFNNFETEVDLQELNGINMGRILHSDKACAKIALHISKEMKKTFVDEIIKNDTKIGMIIDESTSLSNKSSLIVYVRCSLSKTGMSGSTNVFLDLIELDGVTAIAVFDSLMNCLRSNGIYDVFLSNNLTSLTCDGAATMIGKHKGIATLFREKFPSVIVWHCANHRLELSVSDVIKSVSGVNRFKSFIDKLYVVYHASPKNSRELRSCATLLDTEILKIGRVLSTRWVASSFRSVSAVWTSHEALVLHFKEASNDPSRDSKDKSTFSGLLNKITETNFILDLGLMADALQELSELSEALQHRNADLNYANRKLLITVGLFEERKTVPGSYSTTQAAPRLYIAFIKVHA